LLRGGPHQKLPSCCYLCGCGSSSSSSPRRNRRRGCMRPRASLTERATHLAVLIRFKGKGRAFVYSCSFFRSCAGLAAASAWSSSPRSQPSFSCETARRQDHAPTSLNSNAAHILTTSQLPRALSSLTPLCFLPPQVERPFLDPKSRDTTPHHSWTGDPDPGSHSKFKKSLKLTTLRG
jgi:hypothetical protein